MTHKVSLSGMDTLSREATLSKLFLFPFEKGSTLKGKNGLQKSKQKVMKVISLGRKWQENNQVYPAPFKTYMLDEYISR